MDVGRKLNGGLKMIKIKMSTRTIEKLKETNNTYCPTKFIIEDVAKSLNIECDYFNTSLQDLGFTKGYFDFFNYTIELHGGLHDGKLND